VTVRPEFAIFDEVMTLPSESPRPRARPTNITD